jgi:hypothetical protein
MTRAQPRLRRSRDTGPARPPSCHSTMTTTTDAAIQHFKAPDFKLDCGTTLPELVVAYQTHGARAGADGKKRPAVLVSTCFGEMVRALALKEGECGLSRGAAEGGAEPAGRSGQGARPGVVLYRARGPPRRIGRTCRSRWPWAELSPCVVLVPVEHAGAVPRQGLPAHDVCGQRPRARRAPQGARRRPREGGVACRRGLLDGYDHGDRVHAVHSHACRRPDRVPLGRRALWWVFACQDLAQPP